MKIKLLIFLQLAVLVADAQPRDLPFAHITTEGGLSRSNVTCILRDSRGRVIVWVRDSGGGFPSDVTLRYQ